MSSWREMIQQTMEENSDNWNNVILCTIDEKELDRDFDCGYGGEEGSPFTLWTVEYVYFPICYDGAEWAGSAPRNPCNDSLRHQGG